MMSVFSDLQFWQGLALVPGLAACGYLAFALVCLCRWRRAELATVSSLPPITLFKPVRGANPHLRANLESFFQQDYPDYQILFGVADDQDPAIPVIEDLMATYANHDCALVVGWVDEVSNPKVATLLPMEDRAKHDLWVITDSDIHVPSDFLRHMAVALAPDGVGAATCLYTAHGTGGTALRLGAMAINEWFLPSALVAKALGPLTFCFGAAMAVKRPALRDIGGLQALANNLADDFMLGHLVHQAGYDVALAGIMVETEVAENNLQAMMYREIRWGRTIRSVQPAGYMGSILTYAIPLSLLGVLATAGHLVGLVLLGISLTLRLAIHGAVRHFLNVQDPISPGLVPVRDVMGFFVWLASYTRRTVDWRGTRYRVERGGQMTSLGNR